MGIVDSHLHTIDLARLAYPWLESFEPLRRDFSAATYEAEAKRCGIADALHMEVDVRSEDIERETDYVAELAGRAGSLVRGAISACRPELETFPQFLERARDNGVVRGFRRVLHTQPDELSERPIFRANVKRLAGTGLPFDICAAPAQLKRMAALIDDCPGVSFVLDHCGIPAIKDGMSQAWRDDIADIARRSNVTAKISGVAAYAGPDWTVHDLRPFVEHVIGCLGWDRVVWGSDWPVCTLTGTLATWVAATHALIEGCSADERERLLSRNARRLWRLT